MTVATLISANHPDTYEQCTLSLNTLRVGFPTARIEVYCNPCGLDLQRDIMKRTVNSVCAEFNELDEPIHHADWIAERIEWCDDFPLVLVDPDMIFWEDCEGFKFDALIAGACVPDHWNHWSKCAYRARLHTSFLWINDPRALMNAIPMQNHPYQPFDPFMPVMVYDYGRPTFYDTLAILCHALPREQVVCFEVKHLNCYDHINSASFFHEMQKRWDTDAQREEFARIHKLAVEDPAQLRGLWRKTKAYYDQQAAELVKRMGESTWHGRS